jgi:hypothetical protein
MKGAKQTQNYMTLDHAVKLVDRLTDWREEEPHETATEETRFLPRFLRVGSRPRKIYVANGEPIDIAIPGNSIGQRVHSYRAKVTDGMHGIELKIAIPWEDEVTESVGRECYLKNEDGFPIATYYIKVAQSDGFSQAVKLVRDIEKKAKDSRTKADEEAIKARHGALKPYLENLELILGDHSGVANPR